ncbi:hypothetical protein CIT29_28785 (plasmid) [Klebsiella pneumoniae]|nr:hypothetical protein CIT29_28785 [Klebsiella pneumoniae]
MNRRLIVQFDPDEPSMSAPTFAEPDQGPLAGGRKVNARHDLTLGALLQIVGGDKLIIPFC